MKINSKKIEFLLSDNELHVKILGNNLKKILSSLQIQQQELARLSGVNQGRISDIARGLKPHQSWFPLYKIAKTLGVTMDDLVDGTYSIKKIKQNLKAKLEKLRSKNQ